MRKLMMICALVFGVITFTNAQDATRKMPSPEERAKKSTETLAEKLKLSEDQKAKVLAIYTAQGQEFSKQMTAAKDDKTDRTARREQRMAQMAATDAKINEVLTADQKKAYVEMKEARKAAMEKRTNRSDRRK